MGGTGQLIGFRTLPVPSPPIATGAGVPESVGTFPIIIASRALISPILRARALAAYGRGGRDKPLMHEIGRLTDECSRVGLRLALPTLEQAFGVPSSSVTSEDEKMALSETTKNLLDEVERIRPVIEKNAWRMLKRIDSSRMWCSRRCMMQAYPPCWRRKPMAASSYTR